MRAAFDREDGGDRIFPPVIEWQRALQVTVPHDHLDHQIRSKIHIIERQRHKCQRVDPSLATVLPGEIRNPVHRLALLQREQQLLRWRLGAVAAEHMIDLRIGDQLLVRTGGGKAAHDHGNVWMDLLDDARHFQGTVGVRQPMQIDADSLRLEAGNKDRHVEATVIHHPQRQIDDPHIHTGHDRHRLSAAW